MSVASSKPVLVLDWGIGGLSVLRELRALAPNVNYIYLSDAGFTPYGKVSSEVLAKRISHLIETVRKIFGIEHAMIACNAASTVIPLLNSSVNLTGIQIAGVIEPGIALAKKSGKKLIGVIGGERTINAHIFSTHLKAVGIETIEQAAQPLSAFIERGELSGPALHTELEKILAPLQGVEALLLACTHYPAIAKEIALHLPHVLLLDPAKAAAQALAPEIAHLGNREANTLFLTTGNLAQTKHSAKLAFNENWQERPLPPELNA